MDKNDQVLKLHILLLVDFVQYVDKKIFRFCLNVFVFCSCFVSFGNSFEQCLVM